MHTSKKVLLTTLLSFLSYIMMAGSFDYHGFIPIQNLSFIENKGQVTDQHFNPRPDIDYKLSASGINIFIGNGQIHYQWEKAGKQQLHKQDNSFQPVNITTYRMDVILVGADPDVMAIPEQIQKDKETFYLTSAGKVGVTALMYRKITYRNIYPGIDWVLYSNGADLKYDFVVHPGADPKNIKLRFEGATSLNMQNGNLFATTPFGTITEHKPYSYNAETKETVPSSFNLHDNTLSFNVNNTNGILVIDPVIAWGTYFGGTLDEYYTSVKADKNGNIYMCGGTYSTANIATTGTYQTTISASMDAYLTKFDGNGQRLWATYYGGAGYEVFADCDVDKYGNIYAGTRADMDMPALITPGAHQTTFSGTFPDGDVIFVKFDGNGQRLWATYYGGALNDQIHKIACDTSDNVYFYGSTYSNNNIVTPGTQKTTMGAPELYLVKFNGTGQRQWGTYYGGSDGMQTYVGEGSSLSIDKTGNPIITGYTTSLSANELTTNSCFQTSYGGGTRDGFIAKYNKTNGLFIWASYYGGNDEDVVSGAYADDNGNTYLIGHTLSNDGFAASSGCFQPTFGGGNSYDVFIAKFNNSGQRLWGTYYGGNAGEVSLYISYIANKVIAWGLTGSSANIATPGSQYPVLGTNKSFYAIFNSTGQRDYASYFPLGGSVYLDENKNTYFYGTTTAVTGISTPGSYQPNLAGGQDAFLVKLGPDTAVAINQPYTDTLFCPGSAFNLNYTVTGGFNTGNIFTAELSDATGSFSNPVVIGTVSGITSGTIACTIPAATPVGNGYRIRIVASNPSFTSMDEGADIHIQGSVVPAVSAIAVPGVNAGPWVSVTFTATPTAGGTTPAYQWRKNGVDISGATSGTYTGVTNVDFTTGDVITVKLTSNETCASPDTAISQAFTINVNLSVTDVEAGVLRIYPNPSDGLLYITGTNEAMELNLYNAMGQVVFYRQQPANASGRYVVHLQDVPAGIYLLKIQTGKTVETVRLSVQQ